MYLGTGSLDGCRPGEEICMDRGGPRIGFISSYNASAGTASIYYPDRCKDVTGELPVFMPCGLTQGLEKGDAVLVLHLSNGSEAGIVMGKYAQGACGAGIAVEGDTLTLKDSSGSIKLSQIIAKCRQ